MARKAPPKPQQNKRHTARQKARRTGKRQTPALHEHLAMMYPHDQEEVGETPAQETAEEAAGQS